MSRIAATRRSTSTTATQNEGKVRGRVPLGRISTNRLAHGPSIQKVSQQETLPSKHESTTHAIEPFHHVEVSIGDKEDPQDITEFEHIIYRTLRAEEIAQKPLKFEQSDITMRDRNLLIDAICRYHYKLSLMTNTFYRFLGIFDRYLSVAHVSKSNLKLIGCACFLIASKIEDIYPAQSSDLIQLSERAFTRRELFAAEIKIVNAISFDTTFATPLFYLTQLMRINGQTKESLLLARYILEICQSNEQFYGVMPAITASVAVMVTRLLKGDSKWTKELAGYTQLSEEQLYPYALIVRSMLLEEDREETKFMRRKYGSDLFLGVAHVHVPANFK
ncbi:Cyclin, N-terminal domain containing protein [Tritrichomonas foetus]|uniref:Cyclin, N-terminal domain containing protein n=1 Tax=Tritrichomonas foetus TaxID=1144522 RepID=A0A1J4KT32_9EUKA|nr:Cyclin, N-terminal domain containing protein [Tritrichomonas foetus]|eukprot:OHT14274.1 Cyclin, N-terminal domain containing protein [Tritrichomonas foetus]